MKGLLKIKQLHLKKIYIYIEKGHCSCCSYLVYKKKKKYKLFNLTRHLVKKETNCKLHSPSVKLTRTHLNKKQLKLSYTLRIENWTQQQNAFKTIKWPIL